MATVINANDFIKALQDKGLVIVSASEFEASNSLRLEAKRKQFLKRKSLTFKEALDLKLFPITTKQGLENWVSDGKIHEGEIFLNDKGIRMILTSVFKRLGYV